MAETAKALNPTQEVRVPSRLNGCSLADSIPGEDVRRLKADYPEFTFVCYINTSAEVKADCDVCVTSSNIYDIIEQSDVVASTTGLMDFMRQDKEGNAYFLLTECGLAGRAQVDMPEKTFIGPCVECKYMKSNSLEEIRRVLLNPEPEDLIEISEEVRDGSLRCIDAMFNYAEAR